MKSKAIDYFPFDTDFFDDDKIALIEGEFGCKGSYIAVRLLCKIYKTGGYFYQWGEDECLLFTRKLGAEFVPSLVNEVVNGLVRRSFFDKGVFDSFGILTSKGIQERYFFSVKRRSTLVIRPEILLIDVSKIKNVDISYENVYNFEENADNFSQSKVKEIKENKRKDSFPSLVPLPSVGDEGKESSEKEKIVYYFFFKNWAAPNEEYRKFMEFNHGKWAKLSPDKREEYVQEWKQQPERSPRFSEPFLKMWRELYKVAFASAPEDVRADALSDHIGCKHGKGVLCLSCSGKLKDYIELHVDVVKPILWPFILSQGCRLLNYDLTD